MLTRYILVASLVAVAALGQAIAPEPRNLAFRDGAAGQVPPDWFVPQAARNAGYSAELRRKNCKSSAGCAVLVSPANAQSRDSGTLMQTFNVDTYRGKMIRLGASLRLESLASPASPASPAASDPFSFAQLWLRVDRPNRPVNDLANIAAQELRSTEWRRRELVYEVPSDATSMSIGVLASGTTNVWIDEVSFVVTTSLTWVAPLEPRNLDFREGPAGKTPPGWYVNPVTMPQAAGYQAESVKTGCKSGVACAVLMSPANRIRGRSASLQQAVGAAAYRGTTVHLNAWVRTHASGIEDEARFWLRVRAPGQSDAFDYREVRDKDWTHCEIISKISPEAVAIEFGVTLIGEGRVWIDEVSLGPAERSVPTGSDTIKELITMVRAAIDARNSDDQTAKALSKLKLAESLEDRTVEELESEGAGPRSVAAMLELRDASAGLPPASRLPFSSPPRPTVEEQRKVVNDAAHAASGYQAGLPNFICTQQARRLENHNENGWKQKDVIEIQLSYFDGNEHYKPVSINRKPTNAAYESVGGAIYKGEFGSMLVGIFEPKMAQFVFDHWTTLRKRAAQVYSYKIALPNSQLQLAYGPAMALSETKTMAQHGFVYIDPHSGGVLRVVQIADIPDDFPIRSSIMTLDYDFSDVGGRQYLLPSRAELRMSAPGVQNRNEITFRDYRKFAGEAKISFDEPSEKPEPAKPRKK
jgi:hypothetical protein